MPKRTRPQRCRYTIGRQIHMNGKPFIGIRGEGVPRGREAVALSVDYRHSR